MKSNVFPHKRRFEKPGCELDVREDIELNQLYYKLFLG